MFQNIKSRITEVEVGNVVALAAIDGTPIGVMKEAEKYLLSDNLHFYGWVEESKVLGICGFEIIADKVLIHLIAVSEEHQHQGIGSAMIIALQNKYQLPLEAETVEEAVGFYRKLGFITTAFSDPIWGQKYTCVLHPL